MKIKKDCFEKLDMNTKLGFLLLILIILIIGIGLGGIVQGIDYKKIYLPQARIEACSNGCYYQLQQLTGTYPPEAYACHYTNCLQSCHNQRAKWSCEQ